MDLERIVRSSISRAGVIRVRNALNPLLWLSTTGPLLSWAAAYLFRDDLVVRYTLVFLGALPILAALVAYFIWMFREPNRLQSEEFILRQQELSMIERKGESSARPSNHLEVIEEVTPSLPIKLPPRGDK